jgi:hypothetical protein
VGIDELGEDRQKIDGGGVQANAAGDAAWSEDGEAEEVGDGAMRSPSPRFKLPNDKVAVTIISSVDNKG